ncbi:MAG: hypothetical protein Cons2KO_30170 [Congregibacter sp.]
MTLVYTDTGEPVLGAPDSVRPETAKQKIFESWLSAFLSGLDVSLVRPPVICAIPPTPVFTAEPSEPNLTPTPDPTTAPDPDLPPKGDEFADAEFPRNHLGPYRSGETRMPSFEFEGAFRIHRGDWRDDSHVAHGKGGFSVTSDSVWILNNINKRKRVIRYERPTPVKTYDPSQMPMSQAMSDPIAADHGIRGGTHLSGVFYDELADRLYISGLHNYDADYSQRKLLLSMNTDGSDPKWYDTEDGMRRGGQMLMAGQVLKTPTELQDRIGRLYTIPEHWTNIISRVSCGAGLWGWDGNFEEDHARLRPFLNFPMDQTWGEHGTTTDRPARPIFNRLSRYEISFFWEGSYISIGQNAGQEGGINYGKGPGMPHQGNYPLIQGDYDNYFWIWDQDEILNNNGEPWEPRPVEWGYLSPHISNKIWSIQGGYFDPDESRLWLLSTKDRTQGEPSPTIFQFKVR